MGALYYRIGTACGVRADEFAAAQLACCHGGFTFICDGECSIGYIGFHVARVVGLVGVFRFCR